MRHFHVPAGQPMSDRDLGDGTIDILIFDNDAEEVQFRVFLRALQTYSERNEKYKDNWRRMGSRGLLVRIRERAERLWDDLWGREPVGADIDDAIDLINFAAFLVRTATLDETTRDGSWW